MANTGAASGDSTRKNVPKVYYSWLADELARGLPQELNFVNEGRNAELCSQHFAHRADVVVPAIHWATTSPRVLTMVRHTLLCQKFECDRYF
jgi:predicted unusual protein kinase regulating ubiquinone biosynthesis (AarF/ABC1/UbiB family)